MAVDVQFGVVGNPAGMVKFLSTLEADANATMLRINQQFQRTFQTAFSGTQLSGGFGEAGAGFLASAEQIKAGAAGVGPAITAYKLNIDQLTHSATLLGQVGVRLKSGEIIPSGWVQSAKVNSDSLVNSVARVVNAEQGLTASTANLTNLGVGSGGSLIAGGGAAAGIADIKAPYLSTIDTRLQTGSVLQAEQNRLQSLKDLYIANGAEIPANVNQMYAAYSGALARNEGSIVSQLTKMNTTIGQARTAGIRGFAASTNELTAASREFETAMVTPPPVSPAIMTTLNSNTQLRQQLLKAGLGGGAAVGSAEFQAAVADANFSTPVTDITQGVTKLSGTFPTATEGLKSFTAQVDSSGKLITRFGGTLSGASNFLNQVGRDFQKVAEWSIATGVIIGGIGAFSNMIKVVSELDLGLRKFAITAQVTTDQSKAFFQSIAEVAYNTATPLKELVDAADAIALATRKSGESAQQWRSDILSLTGAVGILTNIAGIDSVKATDLLTATMKQLDLTANQTAGVLNKIAAVAGGQSTAIADIAQGLGTLSEAAKAAGLTLDQQIAVLQTLGQVTGKSSTEIATAMKNLTGSISSAGSVKELDKFGIAVKDAQGNLRPFLDIYKEVSDAIASGLIPAGQVQAVEKAISGGPRRMPDAAALLGVIDQVTQATQVSQDATNEALVANAKVLDSTASKITQLKVLFDQLAFNNLSTIVNQVAGTLLNLASVGIQVFNSLPTGLVATIAQFALLAGGVSLVVKIFTGFGGLIRGAYTTVTGFTERITTATVAAAGLSKAQTTATATTLTLNEAQVAVGEGMNITTSEINNNTLAVERNALAKRENVATTGIMSTPLGRGGAMLGIAGLAGVGIGAAQIANGGGTNPQSIASGIGSGLMGLGMTGLMAGSALDAGVVTLPAGLTIQGLSIAATALGGILQVVSGMLPGAADDTSKLDQNTVQLNQDILTSVKAFQDASQQAANLQTTHQTLTSQLAQQAAVVDKSVAGQNTLANTQRDYASNVADLAIQNVSLQASYEKLVGYYPELGTGVKSYSDLIQTAASNTDLLKTKTQDLSIAILKGTGQAGKVGTNMQLPDYAGTTGNIPYAGNGPPIATIHTEARGGIGQQISDTSVNLADLATKPDEVMQLFDSATGTLKATIPHTQQAFDLIDAALTAEGALTGADVDLLTKYHQSLADQAQKQGNLNSIIDQTVAVWNANWAAQNLIGTMTVDQMNQLEAAASGWKTLSDLQASIPTVPVIGLEQSGGPSLTPAAYDLKMAMNDMNATITAGNIPTLDQLKVAYVATNEVLGRHVNILDVTSSQAYSFGNTLFNGGIPAIKKMADALNQAATDTTDWDVGLQKEINKLASSVQSQAVKVGQEQLASGQGLLSKSGQFRLGQSQDAQSAAATQGWESLTNTMKSGNNPFAQFLDSGTAVSDLLVGLKDKSLYFANAEAELNDTTQTAGDKMGWLIDNLASLDTSFGVNKKNQDIQIASLKEYVKNVGALYASLATLASQPFDVQIAFITSIGGSANPADYNAAKQLQRKTGETDIVPPTYQDWLSQQASTAVQNKAQTYLQGLYDTFLKTFNTGTGGSAASAGGAGSSAKSASAVEVPQEWLTAGVDVSSYLKQSIAWAKKYEAAIPGATEAAKGDIVAVMEGNTRVLLANNVSSGDVSKGMAAMTAALKANTDLLAKADTIRRIRVGSGDFAALANVPLNTASGVSIGGPQGPITVSLNVNGQILTPAQMAQLVDMVAAAINRHMGTTGG